MTLIEVKRLPGKKWLTIAFGLTLLLLGSVSFASYHNTTQLVKSMAQVERTKKVLLLLTQLSQFLTHAETAHWRLMLTGDRQKLKQPRPRMAQIDAQLQALQPLVTVTPSELANFQQLQRLIQNQQRVFQAMAQLQRSNGPLLATDHPLILQAEQNQQQILQLIANLQNEEEALLQNQIFTFQKSSRQSLLIEILGIILVFALLFAIYIFLYQQILKRQHLEQVQQKLVQDKALSEVKLQFFSLISHELRTPLSVILGSAQLLQEKLKPVVEPAKLKHLLQIQTATKSMTNLLNDSLTIARADSGKTEFKPELLEMQSFCLNLLEEIQLSDEPRTIRFQPSGETTYAYVDEKLLYAILSNLLSNAIKYSPSNQPVDLMMSCQPDRVIFQIKDTGRGISPEDLPQLFEPFSRGKNVAGVTGTGLGMTVVQKFLEIHRGSIQCFTEVGAGTTFVVEIPSCPTRPEHSDFSASTFS